MQDTYTTLSTDGTAIYTEKRSRFLAFAHHVKDEDEAKEYVGQYRRKYFDARHVCYAWTLGDEGENVRVNDDGEPSGTAGKPIHGIMRSRGLTYCVVVVVRYFGGVKLGTPGLIAAYKEATVEALDAAETIECMVTDQLRFEVPYTEADLAMRWVRDAGGKITQHDYSVTGMLLAVEIRKSETETLRTRLNKIHTLRFIVEQDD